MTASIYLVKGREKSLLRRHPWVFSRGIARVEGDPQLGDTVEIFDNKGQWLARGAYSPQSQIRVRVWTFNKNEKIDVEFFVNRLQTAQALRDVLAARDGLTGYRLIAAESDGLPGITIDKYQDYLVCQLLSAGAEAQKEALVEALQICYPLCNVYERSDVAVRKKEGLAQRTGVLVGNEPPKFVTIEENGVKINVDIKGGHKTGFYLDQRDSREAAVKYVNGKRVLNCFCYTGGFGLYALKGGASQVVNVDVSQPALDTAKMNAEMNGYPLENAEFLNADVFKLLREYHDRGEQFDVVIMDPPKFAESKSQLVGACRGYKDINMLAMQITKPGGMLLTYSCSGLMDGNLFQKIIADAALDAKRDVQFIERFAQAADHPLDSAYPEGFYLKGFACYVK
ncbi:Ribosomal RNA large subunit methyltransferase I [Photobacterium damselae subsp. piscicida]|uniref:Ribosomal RNA large subunit methyltransferase I n=1 Tax=Photobacterium damsela subsp. piscicida TaxID=38294 RepID=A0A1V1VBW6_PHODP|nr:class I SAM-dependent methyltransferase [Photobacterium damselae]MBE8129119.1 class I SAM-dependent methyltransferase [Photobacterium damselae subsp. piscicida]PSV73267.1 methyltransferase domain-containing protein [Photobacterium damselae]PSW77612.1 methyltransferase domain-containing protein [Photobacterium damselae]QOD53784.1 class I SAM-dependent methyltransferase [Photobacterium damselae subsp. piscicida]QOD57614.1 class I SAM-dependent methyltransferase [Photobacterium damselae subsp.